MTYTSIKYFKALPRKYDQTYYMEIQTSKVEDDKLLKCLFIHGRVLSICFA